MTEKVAGEIPGRSLSDGIQIPALMPPPKKLQSRVGVWLRGVALIALTVLAYQQVWRAGYIWDDDIYVTANQLLTAPDGFWRIWFSLDSPSQYFPLVYTSFRFEHALWGLNPAGYHWVNILLHSANALLVWRLLLRLRVPGAWLAAAIFALHPVQVESVAWITERKNVLMGFFFLLALLAWNRFADDSEKPRWRFYVAALVCYAFALSAKTTACTLPAALLLILWWKGMRINRARLLQIVPFLLLGLGMGLVTIWWERNHQGTQGELFAIGLPERFLVAARAVWFYLGKLLWPANLAFSYPRWSISRADPVAYFWIALTAGAAAAIYALRRRPFGRGLAVAALFFVATLSPVLGFIMLYTFRYSFVADHYQYLACLGPIAFVAAGISVACDAAGPRKKFLLPLACVAVLLPLGLRTWNQGKAYLNLETLWRATLVANPGSWMAHNNLGIGLLRRGQTEEAIAQIREALALDPDYAEAHYNLGNALVRAGRDEEAKAEYERALQVNPRIAAAHSNLGVILLRHRDINAALTHFAEAINLSANDAAIRLSYGEALQRAGRREEAIAQFEDALRIDPNSAVARTQLGILFAENGETGKAMPQFEQAVALDPQNAAAHYNFGNALLRTRRLDEAAAQYRRTVEIQPNHAGAHLNLGNLLAESGRMEEAIAEYAKALEINPDYLAAHKNMAAALHRLGRDDEAARHAEKAQEIEARSPR